MLHHWDWFSLRRYGLLNDPSSDSFHVLAANAESPVEDSDAGEHDDVDQDEDDHANFIRGCGVAFLEVGMTRQDEVNCHLHRDQ